MSADHRPTARTRRAPTRSWHLAMLLATLVVPVLLLGRASWHRPRHLDPVTATAGVIRTMRAAIAAYEVATWSWTTEDPLTRQPVAHREPLWDLNHDGVLDGRPGVQGGPGSDGGFTPEVIASGYLGPVAMLRPALAKSALNASGQVVDAWGRPLRIRHDPGGIALWSPGPDGIDGTSDDLGGQEPAGAADGR